MERARLVRKVHTAVKCVDETLRNLVKNFTKEILIAVSIANASPTPMRLTPQVVFGAQHARQPFPTLRHQVAQTSLQTPACFDKHSAKQPTRRTQTLQ